jgi:putative redox protein
MPRALGAAGHGIVETMTPDDARRHVTIDRIENSRYTVTNTRGGTITIGSGSDTDFTPVELLMAAIGGCTGIDVDILTSRRAEPDSFRVLVDGTKVRDDKGSQLTDLVVTFKVRFPDGEGGDKARALLPDAVSLSHDRLCTVSRTIELGTPITPRVE